MLTEAFVTQITLDGNTATGVEFTHDGQKYTVKASTEVILSGGVINTPQILELSGIGDPEVLKAAGVECKIENKRVGANFQGTSHCHSSPGSFQRVPRLVLCINC